ncbi:MAG: hypothetical protein ACTTJH_06490 [Bacteroidales bacterium]
MNDNLINLKTKIDELLQQIIICLEDSNKGDINADMQSKVEVLLKNTSEILKQNNQIILQNNELLRKFQELSDHENKVILQENDIKKEFVGEEQDTSELVHSFSEQQDNIDKLSEQIVSTKDKELLPIEEDVEKSQQEKENLNLESKQQQEIELDIVKDKAIVNADCQKAKTSSVLEFLHQRVIRDQTKSDNLSPSDSKTSDESDDIIQASSIRNITEQIKGEVKQQSENKIRSIAEQFEDKTKRDLLSAIGVSEKFMFINDLFSGNIKEYTTFVNNLNLAGTLTNALEIMETMQTKKKWAKGSLAYTTLAAMITKRFE